MKRESHKSNAKPLNVKDFHCYRLIHFWTEAAAASYYGRKKASEHFVYLCSSNGLRVDNMDANQFSQSQLELVQKSREDKMKKLTRKKKRKKPHEEHKHEVIVEAEVEEEWVPNIQLTEQDCKDIEDVVKDTMIGLKDRLFAQLKTLRV
ncbi:unnamed protein product [Moneuplotes crassus]|uniref:Uncharacterized protein n=1 Tax=Euplotes crassus TaxID=5936 RepID=A0AAD1U531_EUPCR|nr:unnamed protein product [Moneuplotes crassus]